MGYFLQQALNGAHLGALYALLAFGYALGHALVPRANLAHGALFAFAGQVAILAAVFGWSVLWMTLPVTLAFGAVLALAYTLVAGDIVGRHVIAPLAGRSPNTVVAATLGVAIVLMEIGRLAMNNRDLWLPPLLSTPVTFWQEPGFGATLTRLQLINIATIVAMLFAGAAFLARSRFGRDWQAVADDPLAAAMCGVDTGRTFRRTMLGAGFCAAAAGILAALHFGNVSFDTGLVFGLKVLFVAALGFGRSPASAAAGAAAVGMAEAMWTAYFAAEWRDAAVFMWLAAILILRSPALGERDAP